MNILLAHGSTDSRHATQAQLLAERAAEDLGAAIELRFLSSEKMPDGAHVLPLLLGSGWHAQNDVVRLSKASACTILPSLSDHAISIAGMAVELASKAIPEQASVIFSVYHYSGFEGVTERLQSIEHPFQRISVVTMYDSPNISSELSTWHEEGVQNMVIQPITLFEGKTMEKVRRDVKASSASVVVGSVLSSHTDFPAFIADCFRESI